jgi:hypothetical protein
MVHAGRQESGVTDPGELATINRFCCHQQVLFILDVLVAGGKSVDKKYLAYQHDHKVWSIIIFPLEKPPRRHKAVWQTVVYSLTPKGRVQNCIGRFLSRGHKVWEWWFHKESNCLLHVHGAVMDFYTPSLLPLYPNRPNFWTRSRIGVACEEVSSVCSIKSASLAVSSILSVATVPLTPEPPLNFWSMIEECSKIGMWENLTI